MVMKKKSRAKKFSSFHINPLQKQLEKEAEEVERWIIERKNFLKKLGWVMIIVTLLLIVSHFYLRVKGVGI